jgi:hydroxyacylglutathione hydrolase
MTPPHIQIIPILEDNYAYVITRDGRALVIDPGEARPVAEYLAAHALSLSHILITHYDYDHIEGIEPLRATYRPLVIGPASPRVRLDVIARPGIDLSIEGFIVRVIDTPGHACPHVAYYFPDQGWLFSGDCLFGGGCGRLAGDTAVTMWKSLQSLNELPADTQVFFGHEYTLANLAFARAVEPDNPDIRDRITHEEQVLATGGFSTPSTIREERLTNPFLRPQSATIRNTLGLVGASDADVFAALRKAKNRFRG